MTESLEHQIICEPENISRVTHSSLSFAGFRLLAMEILLHARDIGVKFISIVTSISNDL